MTIGAFALGVCGIVITVKIYKDQEIDNLKEEKKRLTSLIEKPAKLTDQKNDEYERGLELLRKSKKRVYMVQKTPIIFFKDFFKENTKDKIEIKFDFYMESINWIKQSNKLYHRLANDRKFVLIYSRKHIQDKLNKSPENIRGIYKENFLKYLKLDKNNSSFHLLELTEEEASSIFPTIFGIGDDDVVFWIGSKDTTSESSLCLNLRGHKDIADSLAAIYDKLYQDKKRS